MNRLLELAGVPAQLALTEGKTTIIDRIYGEVMAALGKAAPGLSAPAKKAIRDGIQDAYDDGYDAGYESSQS